MEWKKKDSHLKKTNGNLENYDRWLYFDSITQDDDGEYECRASNSHGFTTHTFTVTVEGRLPNTTVHTRLDVHVDRSLLCWNRHLMVDKIERRCSYYFLWKQIFLMK